MIPRYLIDAYMGYYEDILVNVTEPNIIELIQAHDPKQRLAVYLQWNGIIGWTDSIWSVAHTETYTI